MKRTEWLLVGGLVVAGFAAGALGLARGQAPAVKSGRVEQEAAAAALSRVPAERQVTVFAILAIPQSSEVDPRLSSVRAQLTKVLPGFGFKLKEVRSRRVKSGQSVTCDLGDDYRAETVLVKPLDENGKVHLRCNLLHDGRKEFSTLIRSPVNQLVFCERSLKQGTRVLIGVGAR